MNRTNMNYEEKEAMHILDLVKAGDDVPQAVIDWALRVAGDLIGVKEFADA